MVILKGIYWVIRSKYENTNHKTNGDYCKIIEYPLQDANIDCATGKIIGRYPDRGYGMNEVCDELCYVISGSGTIYKQDGISMVFKAKDVILIEKGDAYYWQANCEIMITCRPSWYPEQYKVIE